MVLSSQHSCWLHCWVAPLHLGLKARTSLIVESSYLQIVFVISVAPLVFPIVATVGCPRGGSIKQLISVRRNGRFAYLRKFEVKNNIFKVYGTSFQTCKVDGWNWQLLFPWLMDANKCFWYYPFYLFDFFFLYITIRNSVHSSTL